MSGCQCSRQCGTTGDGPMEWNMIRDPLVYGCGWWLARILGPLPVPKAWPFCLNKKRWQQVGCPKLEVSGLFCQAHIPVQELVVMRRWNHCLLYFLGYLEATFISVTASFVTVSAAWQQPMMQNIGSSFCFLVSKRNKQHQPGMLG